MQSGFDFFADVSVVMNDHIFSDDRKVFCLTFKGTDDSHNHENNAGNGTDNCGDPAEERNYCNKTAEDPEDIKDNALVDVIAKEF